MSTRATAPDRLFDSELFGHDCGAFTGANAERAGSFEVARGNLRRDLFYRLNVIPIRRSSLAERREDIRPLALHFLNRTNQANQANQRTLYLSPAALDKPEAHAWPGHIRELANVIERLVLLADGTVVSKAEVERFLPREYRALHSHRAQELHRALARPGSNPSRAAQSLGLTPRQFGYRLRRVGGA